MRLFNRGKLSKKDVVAARALESLPNVIGFSKKIRPRIKGGMVLEGTKTLRVYVSAKVRYTVLESIFKIPDKVRGLKTDVVEIGEVRAGVSAPPDPKTGPHAALMGGVSLGHKDVSAGTMTRVVKDTSGRLLVLTNAHVGWPEETAKVGDSWFQPAPHDMAIQDLDKGNPFYVAARGSMRAPLSDRDNLVDAAVGVVNRDFFGVLQLGQETMRDMSRTHRVKVGDLVTKSGRTTGVTQLGVFDDSAEVSVKYSDKTRHFTDVAFARGTDGSAGSGPGDSGSLIVYKASEIEHRNAGQLFAGSDQITIFAHFDNLMSEFERAGLPLSLEVPYFQKLDDVPPPPPEKEIKYRGSTASGVITIIEPPTDPNVEWRDSELYVSSKAVFKNAEYEITGELIDAQESFGVAGRQISITHFADQRTVTTDSEGKFRTTWIGLNTPGDYGVDVVFGGDE